MLRRRSSFGACAAAAVCVITVLMCLSAGLTAAKANAGYPACDPSVVQSSGYIDIPGVGGTQKHYFYWLFGPRRWPTDGSQPPVVMWMTGGPGCSSNLALLSELGPCLMSEASGELYRNAYGWNDEAFLLFVDQPTGVGFSYGDDVNYADDVNYVHNESEVAEDMYNFLQSFARKFPSPSITGANDFYVIGESYGGHYVPAVAHRVLIGNQRGDGPVINLKGIGIGNGWTDPYTQYPSYAEFAYHWCKEKLGAPCVAEAAYEKMLSLLPSCLEGIKQCNAWPTDQNEACVRIPPSCGEINDLFAATGRNWYDIRRDCKGPLCYSFEQVIRFYRDADVRASLGVHGDLKWAVCSDEVAWLFERDFYRNFNYTFPPLLAAGIRVLIYAGDTDYICNWIGNKAWTRALNWPGKAAFNAAQDLQFALNGRWAGEERAYGNLSFVRIYDAGHMVPMDQPAVSLYMLSQFLHGKRLA